MRRFCIILLIGTSILMTAMGCDDDSTDSPQFSFKTDPGSIDSMCCGVANGTVISGVAPNNGLYYWVALMKSDSLITYGDSVYLDSGAFEDVSLTVPVSYLDGIPHGMYEQVVYASADPGDVGQVERSFIATSAGMTEVLDYTDEWCLDCCTNESNGGLSSYKAFAMKGVDNVVAVKAYIETRYGRLCGAGTVTEAFTKAQQNCFAGIMEHANPEGTRPIQAQVGWIHLRDSIGRIDTAVYMEYTTSAGRSVLLPWGPERGLPVPEHGTTHEYELIRMNDTFVAYHYDGLPFTYAIEPNWADYVMTRVTWQGEIVGRETDMPGTANDPCNFSFCRYKLEGDMNYRSAAFNNSTSTDTLDVTPQKGNRPDEWGIGYDTNTWDLWIWDVHPYSDER